MDLRHPRPVCLGLPRLDFRLRAGQNCYRIRMGIVFWCSRAGCRGIYAVQRMVGHFPVSRHIGLRRRNGKRSARTTQPSGPLSDVGRTCRILFVGNAENARLAGIYLRISADCRLGFGQLAHYLGLHHRYRIDSAFLVLAGRPRIGTLNQNLLFRSGIGCGFPVRHGDIA